MRAIVMHRRGDCNVLSYETVETPRPAAGEVLVRVHAATVNRIDLYLRAGKSLLAKELPHILGADLAGEIVELGPRVTGWQVGERVVSSHEGLGRTRNGSYAEFATLPTGQLHRLPVGLDYIAAASAGLAFCAAWCALFYGGGLQPAAERVVVYAAAGGVGTAALQIARWQNARTIAIGGADKAEALRKLGADVVLDESHLDLVERVVGATGGLGATLVLDAVGRDALQPAVEMLAPHGRVVCVGTLSGAQAHLNLGDLIARNATICGSLRSIDPTDFDTVLQLFEAGTFQPVTNLVLPLEQAPLAHELLENRQNFGKIILVPTRIDDVSALRPPGR
ncbi:quinone oxidoreductase family protein [Gloeobacter morelensis]|uniref:Zinc-binding dehydrogenase n=1 Tax=Gloeobacter morelensis MG652769 TaxID=2781736 RepID=A0ABY3PRT5_9CYAN|nr:zinc-binding dehydrogenase [Gloeobacter morelensis]UFP96336.1 zinc-binding dehydrogenase [Gloeobacter morelensis MG652769]